MGFWDDYFGSSFRAGLENFVIALVVLIVGWLIAKGVASAIEKAVRKTKLDEKFINKYRDSEKPVDSAKIVNKAVYYILLLIVFILFFNILNMNMIANPLSQLIATFFSFIPAVLKAALILLLAWAVATVIQWLIVKGTKKINLQHLFFKMHIAKTEAEIFSLMEKIGKVVFYLILLLFIPGVLDALNIRGVSQPFSTILANILAFIPKLLAAALILMIGWFIAKIIKNIIVNLLETVGSEKLVSRLKLQSIFEGTSIAAFVGNLVFVLMMIPIVIAALEKLDLNGITGPAIHMLNDVMYMIPNIIVAAALVLIGIWLGKFIGDLVRNLLQRFGFDGITSKMNIGNQVTDSKMKPSSLVGYIVQVLIIFFMVVQALYLIKLQFLVDIAAVVTAYLPNVLAAVLILGVALIVSNIVEKVLSNILMGSAKNILAVFAKYAILALAVFMALSQLGIAKSIVTSAFVLILGGLALAFGLAFGLGGKDFASKYLRKFDRTIEETTVVDQNNGKNNYSAENGFDSDSPLE
ncbi:mechanosensitive ion channel [Virgibacillus halophilus]|uniref:Mechanosensitive ion channel n=1 Tax=Tigheibacillus halophilus TaxID=361280 RepID=A0ABU5C1N9_9BACI|nr:mechanosensitive ion channel [Virgibacillus halophilus]